MKNFRMNLKKKIILFSTVLVLITSGFTFSLVRSSLDQAVNLQNIFKKNMTPMKTLYSITLILRDIPFRMIMYSAGHIPAPGSRNKLIENKRELRVLWMKFTEIIVSSNQDEKTKKMFNKMSNVYEELDLFIARLITAYKNEDKETITEMLEDEWPVYQISLAKPTLAFVDKFLQSSRSAYQKSQGEYKIYLVTGLLTLMIVLYMSYFLISKIAIPVCNICVQLKKYISDLMATSDTLQQASNSMAGSSERQANSIEETSSSLEELHGTIKQNVSASEETSNMSREIQKNAADSSDAMKKLVVSMGEVLEANQSIQEMVTIISEIGQKTQVIDEIVFQTKLLSFNASVESERAGDHGRGFAVVAQEVGNLAQMSGGAAREIAEIVNESIQKAEFITSENKEKVLSGNELVKSAANIFSNVTVISEKLTSHSESILTASKEQSIGLDQITGAMSQLEMTTQDNFSSSQETSKASDKVKDMASNLNSVNLQLSALIG